MRVQASRKLRGGRRWTAGQRTYKPTSRQSLCKYLQSGCSSDGIWPAFGTMQKRNFPSVLPSQRVVTVSATVDAAGEWLFYILGAREIKAARQGGVVGRVASRGLMKQWRPDEDSGRSLDEPCDEEGRAFAENRRIHRRQWKSYGQTQTTSIARGNLPRVPNTLLLCLTNLKVISGQRE